MSNEPGFSSRKGKSLGTLPNIGTYVIPSVNGADLKFKRNDLKSEQVKKLCFKSPWNRRSRENLTEDALSDILPEIKKDGYNTHPAIGEKHPDGRIEILVGLRRTESITHCDDEATLRLFTIENLSIEDKLKIIGTSDVYKEPGARDTLLSLKQMLENPPEGIEVSEEHLMVSFNLKENQLNEYKHFIQYVDTIVPIFPMGIEIPFEFLREIHRYENYVKEDTSFLSNLKDEVDTFATDSAYWLKVRKQIIGHFEKLAKGQEPKAIKNEHILKWARKDDFIPNVNVKTSQRQVTIVFHPKNLSPEKEEALRQLLTED